MPSSTSSTSKQQKRASTSVSKDDNTNTTGKNKALRQSEVGEDEDDEMEDDGAGSRANYSGHDDDDEEEEEEEEGAYDYDDDDDEEDVGGSEEQGSSQQRSATASNRQPTGKAKSNDVKVDKKGRPRLACSNCVNAKKAKSCRPSDSDKTTCSRCKGSDSLPRCNFHGHSEWCSMPRGMYSERTTLTSPTSPRVHSPAPPRRQEGAAEVAPSRTVQPSADPGA